MDLNYSYFFIIGFLLLLPAIVLFAAMRNLLGARYQLPAARERRCAEIPEHLKQLYAEYGRQLKELGFHPLFCRHGSGFMAHERSAGWEIIYANLKNKSYAKISATIQAIEMPGCEVEFSTVFTDGHLLLTTNGRAHGFLGELAHAEVLDVYGESLAEQWAAHSARLAELGTQRVPAAISKTIYNSRQDLAYKTYLKTLSENGSLRAADDQTFALRARRVVGLAWKAIKGQTRWDNIVIKRHLEAAKAGRKPGYPVQVEVDDYHRLEAMNKRKPLEWLMKTGLLLGSMLLFAIVFGIAFDIRFMLILLGVIAFHELGHFAAMKLFGYRDLQILFIPFFGAAAIGTEQQAKSWQRVVVAFMGPLPGIVVGWGLIGVHMHYPNELIYQIALIMLLLNYLNLLPIMPLDGGHIFKHVLFEKHPRAQAVFSLLSGLSFALGWYFLDDPILFMLAIFMLLGIPSIWREANMLVKLKAGLGTLKKSDAKQGAGHALERIFEVMREAPFNKQLFMVKARLAREIHESGNHVPITRLGGLMTFVTYAGAMVLPLVLSFGFAIAGFLGLGDAAGDFVQRIEIEEQQGAREREKLSWEEKLARAQNDARRWRIHLNAFDAYVDGDDFESADKHMRAARTIADEFEANDIRRAETALRAAEISPESEHTVALLRQAMSIQEANYGTHDPRLAETLVMLAGALSYDDTSNREREHILRRAINLPGISNTSYAYATAASMLARHYEINDRVLEAENLFKRAVELEFAKPESDSEYGFAQRDLAEFYAAHERYAEAQAVLARLLASESRIHEARRPYVVRDLQSQLGWIMLKQQKVDNARDMFEQALAQAEANLKLWGELGGGMKLGLVEQLTDLLAAQLEHQDLPQASLNYKRIVDILDTYSHGVDAYLRDQARLPQIGEVGSSAYWSSVQAFHRQQTLRRMHKAIQRIKQSAGPEEAPARCRSA